MLTQSYRSSIPLNLSKNERNAFFHEKFLETSDPGWRAACLEENIPLIWSIVNDEIKSKKSITRKISKEELFNEGAIGFIRGFDSYKKQAAASLSTWVCYQIRAKIKDAISKVFEVKILTSYNKEKAYAAIAEKTKNTNINDINLEALSAELFLPIKTLQEIKDYFIRADQIKDSSIFKNPDNPEDCDPFFLEKKKQMSPLDMLIFEDQKRRLSEEIEKLDLQTTGLVEKTIIDKRFRKQLLGESCSQQDVGDIFGLPKQRIAQIEAPFIIAIQKRLGVYRPSQSS